MCPAQSRLMISIAHDTHMERCGVEFRTGSHESMRIIDARLNWRKCYTILDVFPI